MLFSCTINFSETMASIYKDIPLTFIKHIGGNFSRDLKNPRKKIFTVIELSFTFIYQLCIKEN